MYNQMYFATLSPNVHFIIYLITGFSWLLVMTIESGEGVLWASHLTLRFVMLCYTLISYANIQFYTCQNHFLSELKIIILPASTLSRMIVTQLPSTFMRGIQQCLITYVCVGQLVSLLLRDRNFDLQDQDFCAQMQMTVSQ